MQPKEWSWAWKAEEAFALKILLLKSIQETILCFKKKTTHRGICVQAGDLSCQQISESWQILTFAPNAGSDRWMQKVNVPGLKLLQLSHFQKMICDWIWKAYRKQNLFAIG